MSTPPTRPRSTSGLSRSVPPTDNPGGVRSAYLRDLDGSMFSVYRFSGR